MFLVQGYGVIIHFVAGNDFKCSSFVIEQRRQLISLSAKQGRDVVMGEGSSVVSDP